MVNTVDQLKSSLKTAMADTKHSSLINIMIDPMAKRKTQVIKFFPVPVDKCLSTLDCKCNKKSYEWIL